MEGTIASSSPGPREDASERNLRPKRLRSAEILYGLNAQRERRDEVEHSPLQRPRKRYVRGCDDRLNNLPVSSAAASAGEWKTNFQHPLTAINLKPHPPPIPQPVAIRARHRHGSWRGARQNTRYSVLCSTCVLYSFFFFHPYINEVCAARIRFGFFP